jgi:2,4-dienoyl-CoA reductase-like NADH-dependent reductase (Old Yellow Enzyme family)
MTVTVGLPRTFEPDLVLAFSDLQAEIAAELIRGKGIEPDPGALRMLELMRERYRGTLIIAGGFDYDTAEGWLRQGKADLIAFGRKFLANPDLPERRSSRSQTLNE